MDELARQRLIKTGDLSAQSQVSGVSIWRDLERQERLGPLKRVHEGAVAPPPTAFGPLNESPGVKAPPARERIGSAASQLARRGDRLIFDSAPTVPQVSRNISGVLPNSGNLTIITSSSHDIHELSAWQSTHLMLVGAAYHPELQVTVGPQAIANLANLHADEMFPDVDDTTLFHGVTTASVLEVEVDRAGGRVSGRGRRSLRIELNRNRHHQEDHYARGFRVPDVSLAAVPGSRRVPAGEGNQA